MVPGTSEGQEVPHSEGYRLGELLLLPFFQVVWYLGMTLVFLQWQWERGKFLPGKIIAFLGIQKAYTLYKDIFCP